MIFFVAADSGVEWARNINYEAFSMTTMFGLLASTAWSAFILKSESSSALIRVQVWVRDNNTCLPYQNLLTKPTVDNLREVLSLQTTSYYCVCVLHSATTYPTVALLIYHHDQDQEYDDVMMMMIIIIIILIIMIIIIFIWKEIKRRSKIQNKSRIYNVLLFKSN